MPTIRSPYRLALPLLGVVAACTQDIAIPTQRYDPTLSIQSLITPGIRPTAYVYRTVPFFSSRTVPVDLFVRDAVVTLSTSLGSATLRPDSSWNAFRCHYEYFYAGLAPVQSGITYTLSVAWQAQTYLATATTNQRTPPLDSVTYTRAFSDVFGEHEGVVLHFIDPTGIGEHYRFAMSRTYAPSDTIYGTDKGFSACALGTTTTLEEIGRSVYNDNSADGSPFTITVEPAFKHAAGQVGFARLHILDQAAYDFFDQLDRQKLSQYNPFVEPVFLVRSQFGGRAFGVFAAYALSNSVRFVYPE
jgi:hypothetical protein